jgi:hypothetical protein
MGAEFLGRTRDSYFSLYIEASRKSTTLRSITLNLPNLTPNTRTVSTFATFNT